jgi:flagellar hook-associated protein 3 FlgL
MRITNNMVTNTMLGELQSLSSEQSQLQTEVSTGLAVTQPSDDPAAFGQVVNMENQSSQLTQFASNASQALDLANSSYSGLNSLTSIYDRASQLGTLGTSTDAATSNTAYAAELDQLIQQTVTTANSQVDGVYLYGGTATSTPPFTAATDASGSITGVTYVGNSSQSSIPISSTSGVTVSTSGATNQGIADFINHLVALRDALNSGDATALATANTALSADDTNLTNAVAENGAVQSRIESEQTEQQSESTELNTQISNATSADLPSTIVKLNQAQLAYQAALQTAASVMHMSILNYITLS